MGVKQIKEKLQQTTGQNFPRVPCVVDEWEQTVYFRAMTSNERFDYEMIFANCKEGDMSGVTENFRVALIALCCVDENGERVFVTEEDKNLLGAQPAAIVDKLFKAASDVNEVKQAEELAKNSVPTTDGDSSSA